MNNHADHDRLCLTLDCGSPPARASLVLRLKMVPFYSYFPNRRHNEKLVDGDGVAPAVIEIYMLHSSSQPGAIQIPIARCINITTESIPAVSIFALC